MVGTVQVIPEPFTKFAPFTVMVSPDELHTGVDGGVAVGFVDEATELTDGTLMMKSWLAGHGEGGAAGVRLNAMMHAVRLALPEI